MNAILCMMEEHRNIERMLAVVRHACYGILEGSDICQEDFADMIDFIRGYADAHHHGKEEAILFEEMKQHLGVMGKNLITHGMLVEHDYGRLYIKELERALMRVTAGETMAKLDVISNAVGYTNLLQRHITKEDTVVFPFGVKKLPSEVMHRVHTLSEALEHQAKQSGIQERYLAMLMRLEQKYIGVV